MIIKRLVQVDIEWMMHWIGGSMIGWTIGFAINFLARQLLGTSDFDRSYVGYAIFGVCVGFFQWRNTLRKYVNGVAWTTATGLAGVLLASSLIFASSQQLIPPILEYYNPGCLSDSCDSFALVETWTVGIGKLGVIGGLSVAIPTSIVLVLSRYGSRVYVWLFGSLLASLTGLLLYLPFGMGPGYDGTLFYLVLLGPMVVAASSGPFLYVALYHRENNDGERDHAMTNDEPGNPKKPRLGTWFWVTAGAFMCVIVALLLHVFKVDVDGLLRFPDRLAAFPTVEADYKRIYDAVLGATQDVQLRESIYDFPPTLMRGGPVHCIRAHLSQTYGTNRSFDEVRADYRKALSFLSWVDHAESSGVSTVRLRIRLYQIDPSSLDYQVGKGQYQTIYSINVNYADPAIQYCIG